MPYHIENDNAACSGFAVVKDDDGEVMGCHRSQAQAERQIAALYAAEDIDNEDDMDDKDDLDAEFEGREINAVDATKGTRRQEVERILADLRAIR